MRVPCAPNSFESNPSMRAYRLSSALYCPVVIPFPLRLLNSGFDAAWPLPSRSSARRRKGAPSSASTRVRHCLPRPCNRGPVRPGSFAIRGGFSSPEARTQAEPETACDGAAKHGANNLRRPEGHTGVRLPFALRFSRAALSRLLAAALSSAALCSCVRCSAALASAALLSCVCC